MNKKKLKAKIKAEIEQTAQERQWTIRRNIYDVYSHSDIYPVIIDILENNLSDYFEDEKFELLRPS